MYMYNVDVLLNVVRNCKSKNVAESVDWESVKKKYSDMHLSLLKLTSQLIFLKIFFHNNVGYRIVPPGSDLKGV